MQSTTTLELNLQYPNHATTMYAVQNDRLSRKISAVLADGATAWTPPTGSLAIVRFIKPDGTMGFYDTDENDDPAVTWTENVATITLAEQVLTVAGDVWCQVNFYNAGEERLSTFKWKIVVQENVIDDETIESTDYFNILTTEIAEILSVIENLPVPATATPLMDGTADFGSSGKYAREDHRHPTDTNLWNAIKSGYPKLDGKKIIVYGDSISDENSHGSGVDMQPNWVAYLRDHCNATIDNRSVSGKSITGLSGIAKNISESSDLVCDIMVIFAGVNDFYAGRQLGTDQSVADHVTIWGSLRWIAETMATACKTAKIFIVSPLKEYAGNYPTGYDKYKPLAMYRKAIQAFASYRGWIYIDGYQAPLLNPLYNSGYTTYFQEDKLHPNNRYSAYLCDYIARKLEDSTPTSIGAQKVLVTLSDLVVSSIVAVDSLNCYFNQDTGRITIQGSVTYTNGNARRYNIANLPSHLYPRSYVGCPAYGTLTGEGIPGSVWIQPSNGSLFMSLYDTPTTTDTGTIIFAVEYEPMFSQAIVTNGV